jgi:hypothetical protein
MDCPKCDGKLKEVAYHGVRVDRCHDCAGIWFDAREVRALVRAGAGTGEAKGSGVLDEAEADCPRCDEPLARTESLAVTGLHYDQCPSCRGAWLDAGELDQILAEPGAEQMIRFFNELE